MVDRQVGEVEEPVAHPGVLPVDNPELAIVQEVGVEQVVVTRHFGLRAAGAPNALRDTLRIAELLRNLHTLLQRLIVVRLDDGMRVKPTGNRCCVVELTQSGGHAMNSLGCAYLLRGHASALDEARHEPAPVLIEGNDLRTDADLRRANARHMLSHAVNAKEIGVLAADTKHVRGSIYVDAVVAVGDPP